MTNENYYSRNMVNMSDSELMNYVNNKSDFQKEAVLSAISELEKRGLIKDSILSIKKELTSKNISTKKEESATVKSSDLQILYTSKYIMIFCVLVSVFVAGILMALNFVQINKKRAARDVVIASLLYSFLQSYIFDYLNIHFSLLYLPVNLLGVYLLEIYFWKKQVPADIKYNKRNIWNPILIVLLISLPLVYVMFKTGMLQP